MTPNAAQSVAILGSGTWGLSLACMLHDKGIPTRAWDAFPDYLKTLEDSRKHPKLPELSIPAELPFTDSLEMAAESEGLVLVVASQAIREVCDRLKRIDISWKEKFLVICSKGLEKKTLLPLVEVAEETLGETAAPHIGILSGPSHAEEVSRAMPTTVVAASKNPETAARIQETFMTPVFRVYTHGDTLGVELGGSLKNVIAIAAGFCDGLGFGDNSRAALITRGLAEMTRLGVAMGAQAETFSGLTGMGDLIVTAGSRHSRNRNFGEMIAKGLTIEQALEQIGMVVEGIGACEAAMELANRHGVDMPITREAHAVLFEGKRPQDAARDLMTRDPRPEPELS